MTELIVFKFKVEGMTCVACSSAIEKGLTAAFKDKGLCQDPEVEASGVKVVLLMHQMRLTFFKDQVSEDLADKISSEVEDLGFGATLLEKFEMAALSESMSSNRSAIGSQPLKKTTFVVKGMTCASCSSAIEKHFKESVEGCSDINISLLTNKA